ncbi:MAG: hypothetical protein LBI57_01840 [Helicobacteraceae bacterium]|nr:hypothetical protein [Helicobacteraceae bacterium]
MEAGMVHYNNLSEIIMDKENYPIQGGVFIEKSKLDDMKNANYWIISSKESRDMDFVDPVTLDNFNVKSLLDVQTFKGIIELKIENDSNIKLEQTDVFLEAFLYYLENDDFLD